MKSHFIENIYDHKKLDIFCNNKTSSCCILHLVFEQEKNSNIFLIAMSSMSNWQHLLLIKIGRSAQGLTALKLRYKPVTTSRLVGVVAGLNLPSCIVSNMLRVETFRLHSH